MENKPIGSSPDKTKFLKRNEDNNNASNNSFAFRHVVFFLLVIGFGIIVKKNPWILKDIMSVRIHRRRIASNQESDKVFKKLETIFGDRVSRDIETLDTYKLDRSHHKPGHPDMIVFPETTEEVQEIMRICHRHNYIVIPMGFNSGLEGQTVAYHGGLIINMMRMNHILTVHKDDLQVTVEPGIRISELNDELSQLGYNYPVIPASKPSVGGAVSTSGSGTLFKYGVMKDNVASLTAVLPNGELVRTSSRAAKSAAGYDLTSLFIGSEGTLGVITEVTLKIRKTPESISAAVVYFETLEQAARTVIDIKAANIPGLVRMEIVNVEAIQAVNAQSETIKHIEKPHLFLEFEGASEDEVEAYASAAQSLADGNGGSEFKFTSDKQARATLWAARNQAYFSCTKLRNKEACPGCKLFSTDVCVPISSFARVILETEKDFVENCHLPCPIVGHSGDGNFHVLTPIDWEDEDEVRRLTECNDRLITRSIEADGTCTGEHGIGVGKKKKLIEEVGETGVMIMRKIKQSVDPKNILNPGKIF